MSSKPKLTLKVWLQNESTEHDWWSLLLRRSSFCVKPLLPFSFNMAYGISQMPKKSVLLPQCRALWLGEVISDCRNRERAALPRLLFMLMWFLTQISGRHWGLPICPHLPYLFIGLHIYSVSMEHFFICCLLGYPELNDSERAFSSSGQEITSLSPWVPSCRLLGKSVQPSYKLHEMKRGKMKS